MFEEPGADGSPTSVRIMELFAPGKDSLVIYSFMLPRGYRCERPGPRTGETASLPLEEGPCPSCVALFDQLDGAAEHASQWINFAVVAKAPLDRLMTWADERGWRNLRLLSSAGNTYSRDYFGETTDGSPMPMLNVFEREAGVVRHFLGWQAHYAPLDPGQDHRSVGTLESLWNMFDLTREGRGDAALLSVDLASSDLVPCCLGARPAGGPIPRRSGRPSRQGSRPSCRDLRYAERPSRSRPGRRPQTRTSA